VGQVTRHALGEFVNLGSKGHLLLASFVTQARAEYGHDHSDGSS
jgi:hypothetical protein